MPRAYLSHFGAPELRPVAQDRLRRRLTRMASLDEQIRREFVQLNRYTDRRSGLPIEEHLIRINFHCNQACAFCFVSTHLPAAGDAAVREAIVATAQAGRQVTLSGGEPTLHPQLLDYIALAREHSRAHPRQHAVGLQTNAVKLADPDLTRAVVASGVEWVQVSLHGSHAELAEAMTEAPGTFAPQVRGIDNLHAEPGVYLTINFVITRRNYADLVPFVELCGRRWPRAFVNISFVGPSSDVVPKDEALVPRYGQVLPELYAAIARAGELGLDIGGFESMCGVPLCLVPPMQRQAMQAEIPADYDQGEFVHPPVCERCALRGNCFGVRRGYFDLYGAAELAPVVVQP
ncbi:MAG: radical SAM protein [Deltaproteobacteria bacterium]|nr:radical SAM protein [Deltaproteobacteria bacterium]